MGQIITQCDDYYEKKLGLVSRTGLDKFHKSPGHYLAWFNGELEKDTAAMQFGRAFHSAILEPDRFTERYVVQPDFGDCRKKENKQRKDLWIAEHSQHLVIDREEHETISNMRQSIMDHPLAGKIMRLDGGLSEVTARWVDEYTELECQSRADWLVGDKGLLVDLKTTEDASEEGFMRSISKLRYHIQDAFYTMGFTQCGIDIRAFFFIAVEKSPPYGVGVYSIGEKARTAAIDSIYTDMSRMAKCLETNTWPIYSDELKIIEPRWL